MAGGVTESFVMWIFTKILEKKKVDYHRVLQFFFYILIVILFIPQTYFLQNCLNVFVIFAVLLTIIYLAGKKIKISVEDFSENVFEELLSEKSVVEIAQETKLFKKEWVIVLFLSVIIMGLGAYMVVCVLRNFIETKVSWVYLMIVASILLSMYKIQEKNLKDTIIITLVSLVYPLPLFIEFPKKRAVNKLKLWEFYYLLTVNGGKEIEEYEIVNTVSYYRGFMIIGKNIISYAVNGDDVVVEELYYDKPIFYNRNLRVFKFLVKMAYVEEVLGTKKRYSMMNDIFFVKRRGDHVHVIYIRPTNFDLYYLYDVTDDNEPVVEINVEKENQRASTK